MKVVSDRFGSGEMQLPFVLQSAETMKKAVAFLEPHMEKTSEGGKGTLVLATVKGDVHDIGKNLVDIILSNNGYTVINLGIKQAIDDIIAASEEHKADAIGMSGLLVKSTLVMRENLEEMNRRSLPAPVLLGGAALTRSYVEHDLREIYDGDVLYGKDAFEGLRHMDAIMAFKRGETTVSPVAAAPARKKASSRTEARGSTSTERSSEVSLDVDVPKAPFIGTRVVKGVPIPEIAKWLNRTALFRGRWQYSRRKGQSIDEYTEFLNTEVESTLRALMARCVEEQILVPAVIYGYVPVRPEGNDLVVLHEDGSEWVRWSFPRQPEGRKLVDPRLLPAGRRRPRHLARHDGIEGVGRGRSGCSRRTSTPTTCTCTASASRWRRRSPSCGTRGCARSSGSRATTHRRWTRSSSRATAGAATRSATRRVRTSRATCSCSSCMDPERIGVELSDEFQLVPEQSTSALIVHHPQAKYFTIMRSREIEGVEATS